MYAMTKGMVIAPPAPSLRPRPVIAPSPVIARNEAIHCGLGKGTWIATALRASQ
jgi:hypothetical protein